MHHIARLLALLTIALIAQPTTAETDWEEHNGRFCGAAQTGNWETITSYAERRANVSVLAALALVQCDLSPGNSDAYRGNLLHASIRLSPDAREVVTSLLKFLFREDPNDEKRRVFIGLVKGTGVDHDLFHQIESTHRVMPGRRDISMFAARAICVSIDRYEITELADIRANECNTPPFVEPWQ